MIASFSFGLFSTYFSRAVFSSPRASYFDNHSSSSVFMYFSRNATASVSCTRWSSVFKLLFERYLRSISRNGSMTSRFHAHIVRIVFSRCFDRIIWDSTAYSTQYLSVFGSSISASAPLLLPPPWAFTSSSSNFFFCSAGICATNSYSFALEKVPSCLNASSTSFVFFITSAIFSVPSSSITSSLVLELPQPLNQLFPPLPLALNHPRSVGCKPWCSFTASSKSCSLSFCIAVKIFISSCPDRATLHR
mmetsp:Transcript_6829/g.16678  ORF Transcript_6829/g.16678 Transcript_6829/m.16678 type:complete len:248 (+) Transcript_6829:24-767(+)